MELKTPLYDAHVKAGGKIVPFGGYFLPVQYEAGVIKEHMAVRTQAGLFDVSHMGEVLCEGKDALANIQMILTNNFDNMVDGQARYSPMCNEHGGTVDDLIVYKHSDDHYFIVVNAANKDKDYQWMLNHQFGEVKFTDVSAQYAQLALQGPKAMDILKMNKETEKFYKVFCKNTQSSNGMWEQRFYVDGSLAPSWGYQIDETASVVYGVYKHYQHTKNKKFLKETLTMCEKAIKYLKKYTEDIVEEKNKMHVSYDLWEMCEGTHLYSLAAIYAAFETMEKIYDKIYDDYEENRIKQEKIRKERKEYQELKLKIKNYIAEKLYDKERKTYVRNTQDKKLDISIIGAVTPFKLYTPKEKKITNTIENIEFSVGTCDKY